MADAAAEDQPLPKHLCCPITMELMSDPVVADDGNTYACRARVPACPCTVAGTCDKQRGCGVIACCCNERSINAPRAASRQV